MNNPLSIKKRGWRSMYTIMNVLQDISRGCMVHNLNEDCFSYRIIYFVNENGIGTKHYVDTSYRELRKVLENIIRDHLSLINSVAIAQTTIKRNGKCVRLQNRSYTFSLDGYLQQIVGEKSKEYKTGNYGRRGSNGC